jgi:hypothetical protein
MNSTPHRRWNGAAVLSAFLFSACASTQMQSIQREPEFSADKIHKVLIISIARTPEVRQLVEEEFVKQWKDRGVDAVSSFKVLSVGVPLDKAGIAPFARAQGFDSVLVNRLMSRKEIDKTVPAPAAKGTVPAETANMTDYFQAVVASPEYPIDYEVAVLTTNVYDVATEKKVWSGVSQTLITGDVPQKIGPFTKTILKNLYKTR